MKNLYQELSPDKTAVQRLTALWALSESGLGGIMFALKIPLTGFFVGGFAVIIISLIAWFSKGNYRNVIQATILVIMVKAIVSPHSPPPAYLAVVFQGLAGAFLFRVIRSYKLAAVLLGVIAMVESGLQKILVLTLIFGKGLWEAVNGLFTQLSKEFHLQVQQSYVFWVIFFYLLLHVLWGGLAGLWASGLPAEIESHKEKALTAFKIMTAVGEMDTPQKKKIKRIKRVVFFFIIIAFITTVFLWSGAGTRQVLWILARSIAAVLLFFFIFQPLVKYFIRRWLDKQSNERKKAAHDMIEMLPKLRMYISPAYRLVAGIRFPLKKLRYFVLYMIILALYGE